MNIFNKLLKVFLFNKIYNIKNSNSTIKLLIKLFYLDAATKQASRILRKSEQDKKAANAQTLKKNLNKIQEMLPGKKK